MKMEKNRSDERQGFDSTPPSPALEVGVEEWIL